MEFCEDQAANGVAYTEARFSPHLMASEEVGAEEMLRAVLEGFREGEEKFGTKVRVIVCLIRGMSHFARDTLRLAEKYRGEGVVGIDIAGDEASCAGDSELKLDPLEVSVFKEAHRLGVHRTVHAGEAGPPGAVAQALDEMHAERIGHGYQVLQDAALYKRCLRDRVHFECCPKVMSCLMTSEEFQLSCKTILEVLADED